MEMLNIQKYRILRNLDPLYFNGINTQLAFFEDSLNTAKRCNNTLKQYISDLSTKYTEVKQQIKAIKLDHAHLVDQNTAFKKELNKEKVNYDRLCDAIPKIHERISAVKKALIKYLTKATNTEENPPLSQFPNWPDEKVQSMLDLSIVNSFTTYYRAQITAQLNNNKQIFQQDIKKITRSLQQILTALTTQHQNLANTLSAH